MNRINFVNDQAPYLNDTNLNQLQTNVENAINEVQQNVENEINNLQDNIEEEINGIINSGTTNDVNYIKYADGTLIQYGRVTLQSYDKRSSGGLTYWSNDTYVELPVNFIDTNYIVSTNVGLANMNYFCQSYGVVDLVNKIRVSFISTADADRRNVDYICIGKWK